MKIKLLLFSALLSSTVYGATIAPPSDLQEGLEIYMNFDGDSANGYDSYTNYAAGISWGSKPTLGGLGFNGSLGYNSNSSKPGKSGLASANISAQNFTVSFQFKDWQMNNEAFALRMTTSGGQELKFQSINNIFQLFVEGNNRGYVGGISGQNNVNTWQSFTMTSSSTGVNLYLNGELAASSAKVLDAGTLSLFQIGCGDNGNNGANIKTDDFGLWNRALTEDEIKFLASNTANTAMPSAAVPEPGAASLALLGLSGLLINRRRSRNS